MKKSLLLSMFLSLLLILAACGNSESSEEANDSENDENANGAESTNESENDVDYPTGNIELIVGAGPGGGTDNFARATEGQLSEILGTDIRITNQEAASGAVANQTTANNAPDGHTINYVSSTYIISNAGGQNDIGLDQLTPVARMQSDILALFVNPNQFESFEEFMEHAEENEARVGGTHALSPDEMGFLELKEASGLDGMNYVPYEGTGDVQAAVMGNNLDAYVGVISAAQDYVESGDLQPIIIFTEERLEEYPDVPVTVEDYDWDVTNGNERGVLVHSETPPEIISTLEDALLEVYESDSYNEYEKNSNLHYREGWMGSEEYLDKLEEDQTKYEELLESLN